MKIIIESGLFEELKAAQAASGKPAVRFVMTDFICSGPVFGIEFDEITDGDGVVQYSGLTFVYEKTFEAGLEAPEIIRTDMGFGVKSLPCSVC